MKKMMSSFGGARVPCQISSGTITLLRQSCGKGYQPTSIAHIYIYTYVIIYIYIYIYLYTILICMYILSSRNLPHLSLLLIGQFGLDIAMMDE